MRENWTKFRTWFVNVFWYHYKIPTIAIAAGAIFLAWGITSWVTNVKADYTITFTSYSYIDQLQLEEICTKAEELLGDLNGDGHMEVMAVTNAISDDEYGYGMRARQMVAFSDPDDLLFIMDREAADEYLALDAFEPVSSFGLEPTNADEPYYIRVDQTPLFERAGLEYVGEMVAVFQRMVEGDTEDEEVMAVYQNGVRIVQMILETP